MRSSFINIFRQWGLIAASLVIGFGIYILFRQNVLFIEFLFGVKKGILSHLDLSHPLPYFIVYCLPDGLWYLALLHTNNLIGNLQHSHNDRCKLIINIMAMSAPFILEIGQAIGFLAGTFDICDVLTYLFILIIYSLWARRNLAMQCK